MKTYITIIAFLLIRLSIQAQTTAIPDATFEQALIDLGIDSDGTINGQVATSDVEIVEKLDVSGIPIEGLTGIQSFSSLKVLNVSNTSLSELDLSGNVLLEELYCNKSFDGDWSLYLKNIDLSNNPNIHIVEAVNILPWCINLQNRNNMNMDQFHLNMNIDGYLDPTPEICLQVDDAKAAKHNEAPYSSWIIEKDHILYSFSDDCTLGINSFQHEDIQVFPNPVEDFMTITTPNVKLEKITIYNVQGKKVKSFSKNLKKIDMHMLSPGIYFVELVSGKGTIVKKVVKE